MANPGDIYRRAYPRMFAGYGGFSTISDPALDIEYDPAKFSEQMDAIEEEAYGTGRNINWSTPVKAPPYDPYAFETPVTAAPVNYDKFGRSVCPCGYAEECAVHCGDGHETGDCPSHERKQAEADYREMRKLWIKTGDTDYLALMTECMML